MLRISIGFKSVKTFTPPVFGTDAGSLAELIVPSFMIAAFRGSGAQLLPLSVEYSQM